MSLSVEEQTAIILGGGTALLILGGATFKAASLRGDINAKWSSKVAIAVTALDEKALKALRDLRDEIDQALPKTFEPAEMTLDPAPLSDRVEETSRYHRARQRMERNLKRCRGLGRALVAGLILLMVGVLLLTLHYSQLAESDLTFWAGVLIGGFAVAEIGSSGIAYIVLEDRLTSDEILADTASQVVPKGVE